MDKEAREALRSSRLVQPVSILASSRKLIETDSALKQGCSFKRCASSDSVRDPICQVGAAEAPKLPNLYRSEFASTRHPLQRLRMDL